ncbi:MAG TPA: ABC transporter permease [Coxiellaceae bacterium]|nr:ABC transporter permease [Coxiellaceae bacterium]
MKLITQIAESFANLTNAKLRSFLAILGILVGTASVVALVSSGQMATANALQQFKTLGTNLIALSIQDMGDGPQQGVGQQQLQLSDMPALKNASPAIELIAPYISTYSSLYFNGNTLDGEVVGATDSLKEVVKLYLQEGRFVSYLDANSAFCVIGDQIAQNIKQTGAVKLLGNQIQLGNTYCTIIGVLKPWQTNLFMFSDLNQSIIIPLQQAYYLSSTAQINNILFRVKKEVNLAPIQQALQDKVSLMLPGQKAVFRSPEQIIEVMTKQRSTFTWLLGMIGSISLIVGGIGVMNIMLVSVVERRQEIGIRMAIGARRSDIRIMFLVEAVTLTLFGGLLGVMVGVVASFTLAFFAHWDFSFYLLPPLLGFIVSVLVGVISGFYPAYTASQVDPIQCLQDE